MAWWGHRSDFTKYKLYRDMDMAKRLATHQSNLSVDRKRRSFVARTAIVKGTVPVAIGEALDIIAEVEGWSRSKAITEAIRLLVAKKLSIHEPHIAPSRASRCVVKPSIYPVPTVICPQ